MDNIINPAFTELQQRVANIEGRIQEIKSTTENNGRQTIWQFVTFTLAMSVILLGSTVFQTDALRRETSAKLEGINQRFQNVEQRIDKLDGRMDKLEQRMDKLEQRMERIEQSLDELKREIRANRR